MAAAADATPSTTLTMKLLVDCRPPRRRVVFAEAGKDAVDFLFSLLAIPAGTAAKLLGKESMVGSVGNLYASVEALDDSYVQPGAAKDALLCPTVLSPAASANSSIFRLPEPSSGQSKTFYKCRHGCGSYMTDTSDTKCPSCNYQMTAAMQFVPSSATSGGQVGQAAAGGGGNKGFVQGIVTYTVMDNLTVTPMSSISSIALLNTFAVDLGALQEKTVQLGHKEGLEILRASLQSKTVLTDVFLGKKPQLPSSNNRAALLNNGRRHECLTWRV